MLKAIGYWIGSIWDERLPAPQELVGLMPDDQRAQLADYLSAGVTHASFLGTSWCRFGCGIGSQLMGSRDFTDGEWIWPEGLAHYVLVHHVILPHEFVAQALSGKTPPVAGRFEPDSLSAPNFKDYTFWHQWCASRRSLQTLERLDESRRRTRVVIVKDEVSARAKAIETALATLGVSRTNCIHRNCGRKALVNTYLCVEHYLGEAAADPRYRAREALLKILAEFSHELGLTSDFKAS